MAPPAHADILGHPSVSSGDSFDHLPQWQETLQQYQIERYTHQTRKSQNWAAFIDSLRDDSPIRQLLKVNLWFNGFPYKQDNWVYSANDHWASPAEFLENGGDCEDFSIIKYLTLRRLGFPANSMKIAIVYDIYSGTDHAFLVVEHGDEEYVLDNRENMTVASHYTERYKPYYAFNEEQIWAYEKPVIAKTIRKDMEETVLPGNR
ncbi:MAG: transglutaminase-like cysteine peptidase [Alphaproteobacteria bacterium]|nr:transglutaminase-like cysteine peptidase [Alphaproteobacteria bacterium]